MFEFTNLICCLLFNTIIWYFAAYHVVLSYTMHFFPILACLVDERRNLWNAGARPEYPQQKSKDSHIKRDFEKFMKWQVYGIYCFSWLSAMMKCQYPTQHKKKIVALVFLPNDKFTYALFWDDYDLTRLKCKKDASTHPINQKGTRRVCHPLAVFDAFENENVPLVFANDKVSVPSLFTKR